MRITLATAMLLFVLAPFVHLSAAPEQAVIVFRADDGKIAPESQSSLRKLLRRARANGHATVWLTVDTPFDPFLENADEIEAQSLRVNASIESVLEPLLASGTVWTPDSGPLIMGPGCLVRANEAGILGLLADLRIVQIVATD